jgi:hypothetical protein
MLHQFVSDHREAIIVRCRAKVAARSFPLPSTAGIDYFVPMFLDQLIDELRTGPSPNPEITKTAVQHGHDLLRQGCTVSQVVHDYGDICQVITGMALELNAPIGTDDFRRLNRCLDDAIAGAVTQYGLDRDQSTESHAIGDTERLSALARELRSSIHTVSAAFEVIKAGRVGMVGSTGTVLDQSLVGAFDLIDRLIAEVHALRRARPVVTEEA